MFNYLDYDYYSYGFMPHIPNDKYLRPPLLVDLMRAITNNDNTIKMKDLAFYTHGFIFDFDYPLASVLNKDNFEMLILNKFILRRISYETFTPWQIALNVKLNEIMPYYNKLLESYSDWNLFKDGETFEREKEIENNSRVDSRYSKLPQNEIQDVENGTYMTDYTLGQNSAGGNEKENYKRSNNNKIDSYIKFLENKNKIMDLIFNDLESLFYGLE